ncbi:hypothetical protein [Moorena bouillonii]|nr:hypothetical protein [Moorena bouillonii]
MDSKQKTRYIAFLPDPKFPIPDSRFPIPNSRFPIPDSLLKNLNNTSTP